MVNRLLANRVVLLASVVIILAIGGYCIYALFFKTSAPAMQGPPPPLVGAVSMKRTDIIWEPEFIGQTAGSLEVEIRARVGGILEKRTYEEGAFVKNGTQLFLIDPEPYEIALQKAQAQLAQSQADLERTRLDNSRFSKLFAENAASQKDRDDAAMAFKSAQANVQMGQALVREAKMNLGYTKVTAPIDGIVSKEVNSVGTLISIGSNSLLTHMVQVNPLHINFAFPSTEYRNLRNMIDDKVLQLPEDNKFKIQIVKPDGQVYGEFGKIVFTDSIEDPRTATIRAKVEVNNDHNQLMPGQYVRVRLTGGILKDIVMVPQRALLPSQTGSAAVYVVDVDNENTAQRREITLGYRFGDQLQVISGLEDGDMVIVEGLVKVHPNSKVRLITPQPGDEEHSADQAKPEDKPTGQ